MSGKSSSPSDIDKCVLTIAERELGAFARAVSELFGSEHGRQSVDDWINELKLMSWQAIETIPGWRRVTIAAAVRLARRVSNRNLRCGVTNTEADVARSKVPTLDATEGVLTRRRE
jgi:hypothetical protein